MLSSHYNNFRALIAQLLNKKPLTGINLFPNIRFLTLRFALKCQNMIMIQLPLQLRMMNQHDHGISTHKHWILYWWCGVGAQTEIKIQRVPPVCFRLACFLTSLRNIMYTITQCNKTSPQAVLW